MVKIVVMIVDDHWGVRDAMERMVDAWPNIELISCDGFIPAAFWINSLPHIDLLLCDSVLRGAMTGGDVAAVALDKYADIDIVLFSADSPEDIDGMRPQYGYIRKPFGREELRYYVDQTLGRMTQLGERSNSSTIVDSAAH